MKIIYNDGKVGECPVEEEQHVLRHSAAHIMAQAIQRLYPEADFAYGPATEKGFYYDEGINYPVGQTEDFPADTDNGSNFDLKGYDAELPVSTFIYIAPENSFSNPITVSNTLLYNKYWNNDTLTDVPEGYFTIQQHLVTPNGQNFIVLGSVLYNSMTDAMSNINATYGINIEFPYVEATRIAIGKVEGETFRTNDPNACQFYTLGRISQVGTFSPEFADNLFKLYSGDSGDVTPATMRFDLRELQNEQFNGLYSLDFLPSSVTRQLYSSNSKYITDSNTSTVTPTLTETRTYGNPGVLGYKIADDKDLDYIRSRLNDLEQEVWSVDNSNKQRYEQSIRYRLFHSEARLDDIEDRLDEHDTQID